MKSGSVKNMGLDLIIYDDSVPQTLSGPENSLITGISFSGDQWEAFFIHELAVPAPIYTDGDNRAEELRKAKEMFESTLADFPMLSRIEDYYSDAEYSSREVLQLLEECERVLPTLTKPEALAFAKGLIEGCKRAIELNYGLILVAD